MRKSSFAEEIKIGKRVIGPGRPAFIIAELGYNFNDLDEALKAIDAAAEAGVDSIKVQTFRAETIVAKGFDFPAEAGGSNQFEEFKRYEISEETHRAIFERARQRGLEPLSTPSHFDDADLLERVGSDLYKVGSDDLTNIPFIEYVAKKGKPIILSSGMGTLDEVEAALAAVKRAGNRKAILLQCTSNYPIQDPSLVNLRVMETYRRKFKILTGYSDHTSSLTAPGAAAALGAVVIERHYTLDKNNGTPDAFFSVDPKELGQIVRSVREVERMLGDGVKKPTPTESRMRQFTRKSLLAKRDLPKGHRLSAQDVVIKRPALGLPPADLKKIVGRTLKKPVRADEPLTKDLV